MCTIDSLPDDILEEIMLRIYPKSLLNMCMVNTRFYNIYASDEFWKRRYTMDFGNKYLNDDNLDIIYWHLTWKDIWRAIYFGICVILDIIIEEESYNPEYNINKLYVTDLSEDELKHIANKFNSFVKSSITVCGSDPDNWYIPSTKLSNTYHVDIRDKDYGNSKLKEISVVVFPLPLYTAKSFNREILDMGNIFNVEYIDDELYNDTSWRNGRFNIINGSYISESDWESYN